MLRPSYLAKLTLGLCLLAGLCAMRATAAPAPYYVQPVIAVPVGARPVPASVVAGALRWMQAYLHRETGRELRLAGVRIVHVSWRGRLIGRISDLNRVIPAGSHTVDAVFYSSPWLDAYADWPPLVPGHVAAVGALGEESAVVGRVMLHEILHAFGIVSVDASHSDGGGHVTDCRADLMAGGILSNPAPVLDCGHDDYWTQLLAEPYLTTR